MAGDWIPVFIETPNKPEVLAIARKTGRSRDETFGLLIRFWLWIQSVTHERYVSVSPLDICVTVGGDEKFWEVVCEVGWIVKTDSGIEIPNADEWLSKGAKARLLNKKRQQAFRDRQSEPRNENVTHERYGNVTTGEERRCIESTNVLSCGARQKTMVQDDATTSYRFILKSGEYWTLPAKNLDQYRKRYPHLNLDHEFQDAAQWCEDNKPERKTASGMPRFVTGWLKRSENSRLQREQKNAHGSQRICAVPTEEDLAVWRPEE